jgi:hypothetical protein
MQWLLLLALVADNPSTLLVPPFTHTMGFQRVSKFYLKMYLGSDFAIDDPQGMCGAKMQEEDNPSTGKDDHILTMFAVNSGSGQIVYNVRLLRPGLFGSQGSGEGQFNQPRGICCNTAGDVYVADTDNNRVVRLLYTNEKLKWVSVLEAGLSAPRGVDIDSRGRVYVADTGNDRIVVFGPDGKVLATWQAELSGPTAIAVLDKDADYNDYDNDHAVVIDNNRTRINKLSLSGQLERRLDQRRLGLDQAGFAYCAFDRHGNVYITDQSSEQVHVLDSELRYIISHGRPGEIDSPRGLAIWRRFGQVFINEAEGGRYYWIGLDGYFIGCYPDSFNSRRPGTTIAIYVTEVADVRVTVVDEAGTEVRSLTPPHIQKPGEVLIVWDGNDNDGDLVKPGEYEIRMTVRPTYSKPKFIHRKELVGRVRRLPDT